MTQPQNPFEPPVMHSGSEDFGRRTIPFWVRQRRLFNLIVLLSVSVTTGPAMPQLIVTSRFWITAIVVFMLANCVYWITSKIAGGFDLADRADQSAVNWLLFGLSGAAAVGIAVIAVAAECYPGL